MAVEVPEASLVGGSRSQRRTFGVAIFEYEGEEKEEAHLRDWQGAPFG